MKKSFESVLTEKTNDFAHGVRQKAVYTRIIAGVCLIIALVGFILPFASLTGSLSFLSPFGGELTIFPQKTQLTTVSLKDLVTMKKLDQFVFFNKTISAYTIGDYSIYQILKTPLQNYGYLDTATKIISPETAEILANPQLSETITKVLPKYGQEISNILQSASQITQEASQVLTSINNLVVDVRSESQMLSQTIIKTEQGLQIADLIVVAILVMMLVALILLCIPAVRPIIPLILTAVTTFAATVSLIAMLVGDYLLQKWVVLTAGNINNTVHQVVQDVLSQLLGNASGLLSLLTNNINRVDYVNFSLHLDVGSGAFVLFIGLAGALITCCFIPATKASSPKKSASKQTSRRTKKLRG